MKQPPQVDPIANAAVRRSQEAFRIQKAAYRHANGGSSAPTLTQDAQVHLSLELNEFDLTTGSQPEKTQRMVHGLPDFGFLCFCVLGSCILDIRYIHRFHRQKKTYLHHPTKKTKTPAPAILEYFRSFFVDLQVQPHPPQKKVFSPKLTITTKTPLLSFSVFFSLIPRLAPTRHLSRDSDESEASAITSPLDTSMVRTVVRNTFLELDEGKDVPPMRSPFFFWDLERQVSYF